MSITITGNPTGPKGVRSGKWQFSIDRGGTFTDVIGIDPDGRLHTAKLLSDSPAYPHATIKGIRRLLDLPPDAPIPEDRVARVRMGTTVATNALLKRKGASVALVITKGFHDLLEIGYQNRPELYQLAIKKPEQLYRCVKEVDERIDPEGKVITPLKPEAVEADLRRLKRMGIGSVAIVLMHAWKNSRHEEVVARLARGIGFKQVAVSHEIMPLIKFVGRAQTTVVDAYLSPILKRYVDSVRRVTGGIPLEFMQSSGGLTDAAAFTGKDAIISGPAGGVIGTAAGLSALRAGWGRAGCQGTQYPHPAGRDHRKPGRQSGAGGSGGGTGYHQDAGWWRFRETPDPSSAIPLTGKPSTLKLVAGIWLSLIPCPGGGIGRRARFRV